MADSQPSKSGIIIDSTSGERHIPESQRADGSTRKAIKIRPGYRPPEDVEVYKNPTAETFRSRGKGPIPGAGAYAKITVTDAVPTSSAASNKNAKRREARKKAKAVGGVDGHEQDETKLDEPKKEKTDTDATPPEDAEAEREKKARNLKKKLKQARELKSKREGGEALLPEQIAKVIKINELIRELEALGLDADEGAQADANHT